MEINHVNESVDIFTMHRWDGSGNDLLVVASLANEDQNGYRVGFPQGGVWHEIFNSQASIYGGNGSGNGGSVVPNAGGYHSYGQSAYITVPRMSVTVFRLETCTNDGQCDDGIACTADACDQGGCVHTPNDGLCPDDGVFCNGAEYCDAYAGCVSTGYACSKRFCDEAADACVLDFNDPAQEPAELASCLFGPGAEPTPMAGALCTASCLDRFDIDLDDDVDLMDFSMYQAFVTATFDEYLSDAAGWKARFAGEAGYAFDSFYPGISGFGALSGPSVVLNLGGVDLTITDTTGTGAIWDNSSIGGDLSDAAIHASGRSVWEFSQPIYGLYTYYASLAGGNLVSMTLYSGASELATYSRDNGGFATQASGHGFTSTVGVTRVDFEIEGTDNRVLIGAATGLGPGEDSLGTINIPGYSGPTGSTVQLDFAISTDRPAP